jgi:hypothetical protein
VIGTDCIGSCKSNYYMVTTTTVPLVHSRKRKNPIDFIIDASQVNVAVDKR